MLIAECFNLGKLYCWLCRLRSRSIASHNCCSCW